MPRLYDNGDHKIYRVTLRGVNRAFTHVTIADVNIKASSPSVAADWALSYPHYCKVFGASTVQILNAYKVRKQPVWLRKHGSNTYRFDVRNVVTIPLTRES
jgi:hypothetical protein